MHRWPEALDIPFDSGVQPYLVDRESDPITGDWRADEPTPPPDRFSYPFGRHAESARNALQHLGVELGCTSVPRTVSPRDERRTLARLQATGMDGDEFARWLRTEHALLR